MIPSEHKNESWGNGNKKYDAFIKAKCLRHEITGVSLIIFL